MTNKPRIERAPLALLGLFVIVVSSVGVAWACVPIPQALTSLSPRSSGPAGSEITVIGFGYDELPVEIRWNGLAGKRLASATGPDFSVPVTIPEAKDGLYGIVVLSRAGDGSIGSAGSAPFQIVSEDSSQAPPTSVGVNGPSGGDVTASSPAPSPLQFPLALAAGAGLLALGSLGGALLARRGRSS